MGTGHAQGLILPQQRDLTFQLFGEPLIICVDKGDEGTGGLPDCAISGSRWSSVSLRYRNTTRRIRFKDLHGVVGTSIINGIYREILMSLSQYTIESTADMVFNVVAGNDDIYFALGW
ncbi:MAG TPA: hypothetical protein VK818_19795 [Methylomirabilota bacterium]|nr:hypothetical protein [Methylomirabilota bacterium]